MRIGAYTNSNIYTKQKTNNYSTNIIGKTQSNKNNIAFGSYLDDKLARLESDLSSTREGIKDDADYYARKKRQNNEAISELDSDIQQKKVNNEALSGEIKKVIQVKEKKDVEIAKLEEKNQVLDQALDETKKESVNLKKEKTQLLTKIEQDAIDAEIRHQEEIKRATTKTSEAFRSEIQTILVNPKTTLIERVITPTKLESRNGNAIVPGGVLIESESKEHSKKLFEWITKRTNSNYSIIDATSFDNKSDLFKTIANISKKAQKDFETSQKRTFTFIDNFENCATPTEENRSIIASLKNFLDTNSTDSHNTLVISTKDPSKLDPIISADHRFQVKVKIDNDFMEHNQFGYKSILKETEELKSTGKEIRDTSLSYLFKRAIKRTKEIFSSTKQPPKKVEDSTVRSKVEMGLKVESPQVPKQQVETQPHQLESKPPISDSELKNSLKKQSEELRAKYDAQMAINPHPPTPKEQELLAILDAINDLSKPKGLGRIAGYEEQKGILAKNLGTPIALKRFGKPANVPNGVLLFGPKGVGKTTFSRALAEQLDCKFVSIMTELNPREDFKNLRNAAILAQKNFEKDGIWTMIGIDEFDVFAPKNSRITSPMRDIMDDLSLKYHCTIIAATEHPEQIDDILLRDRRFDIKMGIPPANKDDVKAILKHYLEGHVDSKTNYDELAERIAKNRSNNAYSNARISNIVKKLVSNSRIFGKNLTQDDILKAIKKTTPDISTKTLELFKKQVEHIKHI